MKFRFAEMRRTEGDREGRLHIHGEGGEATHRVRYAETSLEVAAIDLMGEPAAIRLRISILAGRVRAIAPRSRLVPARAA